MADMLRCKTECALYVWNIDIITEELRKIQIKNLKNEKSAQLWNDAAERTYKMFAAFSASIPRVVLWGTMKGELVFSE